MVTILSLSCTTDAWNIPTITNHCDTTSSSKSRRILFRSVMSGISTPFILTNQPSNAAETIGKDPKCNDVSCIGVWDGLLAVSLL
jgi:hypothetical protein